MVYPYCKDPFSIKDKYNVKLNKRLILSKKMSLHSYYINLDSAETRRSYLENNYHQRMGASSPLSRIQAVTPLDIEVVGAGGTLKAVEKACFISHIRAFEASLANNDHALILEDDAHFGVYSNKVIDHAISSLEGQDWDILYADLGITNPAKMVELFMLRKDLFVYGEKAWKLLKIDNIAFVGATAYIVNRKSKIKLYQYLKGIVSYDVPFDLVLRNLVWSGSLSAFMIFPFATTLSSLADSSQIQVQQTQVIEIVWNSFRRLVWLESDDDGSPKNPELKDLVNGVADTRSRFIGDVMALSLAAKFGIK